MANEYGYNTYGDDNGGNDGGEGNNNMDMMSWSCCNDEQTVFLL